ncbi:MAG TPA: hypothetical protein PKY82_06940 [Pyrinomonadaceae bacterium]|nr:hypothetical protein [Pyrinomonadaceae bacterium]
MLKRGMVVLWLGLVLACSMTILATTPEGLSPEQLGSLAVIKHKINGVHELAASGVLTTGQAAQATDKYLIEAEVVAGRRISLEELSSVSDGVNTSDSTWLSKTAQRLADWITFGNTVITIAVLGFMIGFLIIFRQAIRDLLLIFKEIPVIVYEILVYAFGLVIVGGGRIWFPENGYYLGLFGCLILSGAVAISFYYHAPSRKSSSAVFFLILSFIFAGGALYYSSSLIGGFAVLTFISTLSFEDAMDSLSSFIGFENEGALARVTTASYVMIAGHVIIRAIGVQIPALQIFEPGMLYLGSLGGYTGILISSCRWYFFRSHDRYLIRQIVAIMLGSGALIGGLSLGIPVLQKIGGTFLALYLLEKILEIISLLKIRGAYALGGVIICFSAGLAGAGIMVVYNQEFFRKYLLFL